MFKISLRDARKLSGKTIEGVAGHCGLPVYKYNIIENDPSQSPLSLMLEIAAYLGLSLDLVFPGDKADCLTHNRSWPIIEK